MKEYYCEDLSSWVRQEDVSVEVDNNNNEIWVHFLLNEDITQSYYETEIREV